MSSAIRPRAADRGHLFVPYRLHRRGVLVWLRRTHAWLGLWGATLGLLFGATGILLNHRATLKIAAAHNVETRLQVVVPDPPPVDPAALGDFLREKLRLSSPPTRVRREPARPAPWGDGAIRQPEKWQLSFITNRQTVVAEYWVGNRYAAVRRLDPNFFAWLNRLHMGTGAGAAWVLLADTFAGGVTVLALTGLLLWTRLHGPRLLALGLVGACLSSALLFAFAGW